MQIPVPEYIAKDLANRAVIKARARAPRSKEVKEHGADFLYPIYRDGSISIGVPAQYKYMLLQDKGTKEHVQTELAGKVIPIRGSNGQINFRYVNPAKIGQPIVVRDKDGSFVGTKRAWTHPGLPALNFIESSIREVVEQWKSTITQKDAAKLLQESPAFQELIAQLRRH